MNTIIFVCVFICNWVMVFLRRFTRINEYKTKTKVIRILNRLINIFFKQKLLLFMKYLYSLLPLTLIRLYFINPKKGICYNCLKTIWWVIFAITLFSLANWISFFIFSHWYLAWYKITYIPFCEERQKMFIKCFLSFLYFWLTTQMTLPSIIIL